MVWETTTGHVGCNYFASEHFVTCAECRSPAQRTVERGPAHLARLEVLAALSELSGHLTALERHLAAQDHALQRGGELAELADQHQRTVRPLTQLIDAKLADAR